MTLNLDTCKILIADDSTIITSCITSILSQSGKNDIYCAHTPYEVINLCQQMDFDLIISDYNFEAPLNGSQLLEELKHTRMLPAHTTFVFLTSEDSPKVIRTIADSEADDFLLKPINDKSFCNRLSAVMKRRSTLLPIFEKLQSFDFAGAIEASNALLPAHPEYDVYIRKYRAFAMVKNKQFGSALIEYEQLNNDFGLDWMKVALANTLIKSEKLGKARAVLDTVDNKQDNPSYHDEMSKIAVENDDFPTALKHLKQSIMLLDSGAERELVITNLSLANESYDDAVTYIQRYYEKNVHTFRNDIYTKLNFTRCYLYRALDNPLSICFNSLLSGLNPLIRDIENDSQLKTHSILLSAHIALIRSDLSAAKSDLRQVLNSKDLTHFYDLYHLCMLLERCSLLNEMELILPRARASISELQHPSIRRSQIHMLKKLELRLLEAKARVDVIRKQLYAKYNQREHVKNGKRTQAVTTLA